MNAAAPPDFIQVADYQNGSDSDTNIDDDDAAAAEFYQPVSAVDFEDDEDQIGNDAATIHSQLHSNGVTVNQVEGGISFLQLNDDVGRNDHLNSSRDGEAEEEEVEEEEEEASDSAIMRAFREDESRRNAPLTGGERDEGQRGHAWNFLRRNSSALGGPDRREQLDGPPSRARTIFVPELKQFNCILSFLSDWSGLQIFKYVRV
ncbi:uncharacterized protein LOC103935264 isoform X2 [Pyrus x bretschneideri]|uniref:uncharacterized protein LOC103935264 isoform X2 n=1 Tax=Pyrus x bretschneideri TaxID=225117 RepID=UPI00202EE8C9|nr:uncharacterized protein LOC103935264 isoform X2 [Pyrus x bretschneideri]